MRIRNIGSLAVLWLAFTGMSFGAPVLTFTSTFQVAGGGQFSAQLNGGPNFDVFCADFNNTAVEGQMVNIDTVNNLNDTRYGTTTDTTKFSSFSGLGITALQRYVMAGWLTTQFDMTKSTSDADNLGVQTAIWNLLNVTGSGVAPLLGNESTWINAAKTWLFNPANTANVNLIKGELRIYTDVKVAGLSTPERYGPSNGSQEFIGLVPEPSTYLMLGTGMALLGLVGRRRYNAKA